MKDRPHRQGLRPLLFFEEQCVVLLRPLPIDKEV